MLSGALSFLQPLGSVSSSYLEVDEDDLLEDEIEEDPCLDDEIDEEIEGIEEEAAGINDPEPLSTEDKDDLEISED